MMKAIVRESGKEVEVRKVIESRGVCYDDECYYEDENDNKYDESDLYFQKPIDWKKVRVQIAMKIIENSAICNGITLNNWSDIVFEKSNCLTKKLMEDIK